MTIVTIISRVLKGRPQRRRPCQSGRVAADLSLKKTNLPPSLNVHILSQQLLSFLLSHSLFLVQGQRRGPQYNSKKFFFTGVKPGYTAEDIRQYFSEFGRMKDSYIPMVKSRHGDPRGIGFVEFQRKVDVIDFFKEDCHPMFTSLVWQGLSTDNSVRH